MSLLKKIVILTIISQNNIIISMQKRVLDKKNTNKINVRLEPIKKFDFNKQFNVGSKIDSELRLARENSQNLHESVKQLIEIAKNQENRISQFESENIEIKEKLKQCLLLIANYHAFIKEIDNL